MILLVGILAYSTSAIDYMYSEFAQAVTFIYVKDLEKASQFWEQTLGLPLALTQRQPDGSNDVARIFAINRNSFIGCVLTDPKSKGGTEVVADGVTITLVSSEVDEWARRLRSQSIPLEKGPVFNERYNIYHIFFRDPDGHLCEIQEFRDPNWPKPAMNNDIVLVVACVTSLLLGFALSGFSRNMK